MDEPKAMYVCNACGHMSEDPGTHCDHEMKKQCDCGSGKMAEDCCLPPAPRP